MSETTRVPIVVNGTRYLTAPDDAVPDGVRTSAIVQARLIDELTGAPPAGPITVSPAGAAFANPRARAAVNPRAADGAAVGLVGIAVQALPGLGTTGYEVGVAVDVRGYVRASRAQMLGPTAQFPAAFFPAVLPDIRLHREPVMLHGRANLRTATTFDPLPNATVRVGGIWRTAPTLTVSPPASPPNLVAVDPVMYAGRAAASAVRVVTLMPDLTREKRLTRTSVAGDVAVHLTDRDALAPNGVLGIEVGDPMRAEWVVVKSVTGAVDVSEPCVATLEYPLARTHVAGALAHPIAVGAPSASQPLALDAIAGDTTLLLSGMAGLSPATVEIAGGGVREYHRVALYRADTDGDGQWRLPPLSRVVQVTLAATHATATSPPRTVTIEYPRREQRVDLVFT